MHGCIQHMRHSRIQYLTLTLISDMRHLCTLYSKTNMKLYFFL